MPTKVTMNLPNCNGIQIKPKVNINKNSNSNINVNMNFNMNLKTNPCKQAMTTAMYSKPKGCGCGG